MAVLTSKPVSGPISNQQDRPPRQLLQALRQRMILRHQLNRCRPAGTPADQLSYRAQAILSKLALLEQSIQRQYHGVYGRETA